MPLSHSLARLCYSQLYLGQGPNSRHLRKSVLLRWCGRIRYTGYHPRILRGRPVLCDVFGLRRGISSRRPHLHLGHGQPGISLQARRGPRYLWHVRAMWANPGCKTFPQVGRAIIFERNVGLRRNSLCRCNHRLYSQLVPTLAEQTPRREVRQKRP